MDLPDRRLIALALVCCAAAAAQEGKILRPADKSYFPIGDVDVAATAPGGRVELDGETVPAEEPFPDVFHARLRPDPGEHTLAAVWPGGRQEVRFWVGGDPPEGYALFRQHPPVPGVVCTQCHGVSRRGRFRFTGDCFTCHVKEEFTETHAHPPHILERCGDCHNAHGSTAAAHMIHDREIACRLCHGL